MPASAEQTAAHKKRSSRALYQVYWYMLSTEKLEIQPGVKKTFLQMVQDYAADMKLETEEPLLKYWCWWYSTRMTTNGKELILAAAANPEFTKYAGVVSYLSASSASFDEGPWHIGGEEPDTGYCVSCGRWSENLVNGLCPACR